MGLDRPLREHICFSFEITLIIQHFQRAQQEVALIRCKGQIVATAVDQSVFLGKRIIQPVQVFLFGTYHFFWIILRLILDELSDTVTDLDQSLDAALCGHRYCGRGHAIIFPEVDFSIHHGKGKIAHIRVGRNRSVRFIRDFIDPFFILRDFSLNVLDSFA